LLVPDPFSEVGRAASGTKSGPSLFIEPIDHGKLARKEKTDDNDHEDGHIPEGLEARKGGFIFIDGFHLARVSQLKASHSR
jgi:hypothetical protein